VLQPVEQCHGVGPALRAFCEPTRPGKRRHASLSTVFIVLRKDERLVDDQSAADSMRYRRERESGSGETRRNTPTKHHLKLCPSRQENRSQSLGENAAITAASSAVPWKDIERYERGIAPGALQAG
jgi:hypothetical protein